MTIEQSDLIAGYVKKCAEDYHSTSVIGVTRKVQSTFEKNSNEDAETLGVLLGDVILDAHLIGLADHQKAEYYQFWTNVAEEVKSA